MSAAIVAVSLLTFQTFWSRVCIERQQV